MYSVFACSRASCECMKGNAPFLCIGFPRRLTLAHVRENKMKKIMAALACVLLATAVMAAQCAATTKKGTQCKRQASPGSSYCWQHGGKASSGSATTAQSANAQENGQSESSYRQCQATTAQGARCSRKAQAGSSYCWQHSAAGGDDSEASSGVSVQATSGQSESPAQVGGQCTATTKSGKRCSRKAQPGSNRCWQHAN